MTVHIVAQAYENNEIDIAENCSRAGGECRLYYQAVVGRLLILFKPYIFLFLPKDLYLTKVRFILFDIFFKSFMKHFGVGGRHDNPGINFGFIYARHDAGKIDNKFLRRNHHERHIGIYSLGFFFG